MSINTVNNLLRLILVSLLFGLFAIFLLHPLFAINQDLGRHFKVSEIILQTKSIPTTNLFSYTNTDFSFVNTHWLGGMLFYFLSAIVGLKGLIVFKTIVILASFGIIFYLSLKNSCYGKEKNFWLVFLTALLAMGILMERTDARPEIFSFLFFSFYLLILCRYRSGSKIIWMLPFLQVFWVNTHVYFFLGPLLFLFFFAGKLFQEKNKKELKKFLVIGLLVASAVFVNPNGISGALYPLTAMGDYGYTIVENQTPFFLSKYSYHQGIMALFFLVAFFLAVGFLLNRKKLKIFELSVAVFFFLFGIYAVRNFPLFALCAMPALARNFSAPWFEFRNFLNKHFGMGRKFAWEIFLSSALIVILALVSYSSRNKIDLAVKAKAGEAVNFLVENNIQGNMFNNFDVGGYLTYRLYPEKKVFVDNRPEAYPVSFFRDVYIPMQESEELWEKFSSEYNFNFIFFEHTDITPWAQKFLGMISNNKEWLMVYLDDSEIIFVKNLPENKKIIDTYAPR